MICALCTRRPGLLARAPAFRLHSVRTAQLHRQVDAGSPPPDAAIQAAELSQQPLLQSDHSLAQQPLRLLHLFGEFAQGVAVAANDALGGFHLFGKLLTACGGRRYPHVPRNEAVHRTLRPVFTRHPGWSEDLAGVRRFGDLPRNAQRYVAAMVKSVLDVAYGDRWPKALPNLRYLGVGPLPAQIIRDVPATAELVRIA